MKDMWERKRELFSREINAFNVFFSSLDIFSLIVNPRDKWRWEKEGPDAIMYTRGSWE